MVLVGVDIGATKTQIILARSDAEPADRVLPTDGWRVRRYPDDARALAGLIHQMVPDQEPAVVVVGAHGCDSRAECLEYQRHLEAVMRAAVLVVNDAELLVAAAGHDRGIGVVAGTGSIAVSRLADGTMLVAGGWGWLLGDEGGAVGLVREALRAARFALDSGQTSDPLIERMKQALDTEDPIQFGRKLLRAGGAAAIGRHAPVVFAAAEAGSALARTVVRDGGRALATLAGQLVGRGAAGGHVVTAGGVIAHQPTLMDAFREALAASLPDWRLTLLSRPPAQGAIALARVIETCGVPFGHAPALQNWRLQGGRVAP